MDLEDRVARHSVEAALQRLAPGLKLLLVRLDPLGIHVGLVAPLAPFARSRVVCEEAARRWRLLRDGDGLHRPGATICIKAVCRCDRRRPLFAVRRVQVESTREGDRRPGHRNDLLEVRIEDLEICRVLARRELCLLLVHPLVHLFVFRADNMARDVEVAAVLAGAAVALLLQIVDADLPPVTVGARRQVERAALRQRVLCQLSGRVRLTVTESEFDVGLDIDIVRFDHRVGVGSTGHHAWPCSRRRCPATSPRVVVVMMVAGPALVRSTAAAPVGCVVVLRVVGVRGRVVRSPRLTISRLGRLGTVPHGGPVIHRSEGSRRVLMVVVRGGCVVPTAAHDMWTGRGHPLGRVDVDTAWGPRHVQIEPKETRERSEIEGGLNQRGAKICYVGRDGATRRKERERERDREGSENGSGRTEGDNNGTPNPLPLICP